MVEPDGILAGFCMFAHLSATLQLHVVSYSKLVHSFFHFWVGKGEEGPVTERMFFVTSETCHSPLCIFDGWHISHGSTAVVSELRLWGASECLPFQKLLHERAMSIGTEFS